MNELLNSYQKNLITTLCSEGDASKRSLAEKAIVGILTSDEIEELCTLISNEFMLNGITETFEPNGYGKELEDLLDVVNKIRTK